MTNFINSSGLNMDIQDIDELKTYKLLKLNFG